MNEKKPRYITGFDGLRAISVIVVILYHLFPDTMRGGYLGVVVFFVLSGYLITDLMLQEYLTTSGLVIKDFYCRRLKRLYPAMLVTLLGSSVYMIAFQRNLLTDFRGVSWSTLTYLNNWWQIKVGSSYFERFANSSPFTHIWSLAIEGQFYFIWPILFVLLVKIIKKRAAIFGILFGGTIVSAIWMAALYVPNADPSRVYFGTDTRIFSILIGVAFAFLMPSYKMKTQLLTEARRLLDRIGLLSLGVLLVLFVVLNDRTSLIYYGGMWGVSMIAVLLVVITAHPGASLNKWLTNPVFTYLGKRSYGIYLYQYPIMIFFETKIKDINHHIWLYSLIELVLILLVSELSYRFVEVPLKQFNYRRTYQCVRDFIRGGVTFRKLPIYLALLLSIVGVLGMFLSPTKQNEATLQIERKIKANQALLAKKKTLEKAIEKLDQTEVAKLKSEFKLTDAQILAAHQAKVTAFGDSILLAASDGLQEVYPQMLIDAEVGRQVYSSVDELEKLKAEGNLADKVLISLGTNGSFTEQQFESLMKVIGKRQVYWLTVHVPTRRWQDSVNQLLAKMAKKYKNLTLIDWYQKSLNQTDWFYEDNVHPDEAGKVAYVDIVVNAINQQGVD
ncbi:MAG: acetyltransferase [Streptococcaceae bacterium]|jgi:peptidoglycan/LPS O-acetylase OafA/YrhL/lysophospholipase L1-like esterase|nr:acetyltransferase [Streptococcaceae bacterium]